MTIESVCNQALDLIGYKRHIGNIWDGTRAARIALNAWAVTRDGLFIAMRPEWARNDMALTLLREAPANGYTDVDWNSIDYPDLPWLYEYDLPDDYLLCLQIKPRIVFLPDWRPRPNTFRVKKRLNGNDTVLTNVPTAILTYIYQVLDPAFWHDDFTELMVRALASKFEAGLAERPAPRERENADAA